MLLFWNNLIRLKMNNRQAYDLLGSNPSIRASSEEVIRTFGLPDTELNTIRRKFRELKLSRDSYLRNSDLSTWEDILFYFPIVEPPAKKRSSVDKTIFEADLSSEIKGLRVRLSSLLHIEFHQSDCGERRG